MSSHNWRLPRLNLPSIPAIVVGAMVLLEQVLLQRGWHEDRHVHAVELVECDQVHIIWPQHHGSKLCKRAELLVSQCSGHKAEGKVLADGCSQASLAV